MYIRWKTKRDTSQKLDKVYKMVKTDERIGTWPDGSPRYKHTWVKRTEEERTLLIAYVCTSTRRRGDGGRVRQQARYLASIRCEYLTYIGHQAYFWQHAAQRMKALALSDEQQQQLTALLAQRVPHPSEQAIAQHEAAFQAFLKDATARLKTAPPS